MKLGLFAMVLAVVPGAALGYAYSNGIIERDIEDLESNVLRATGTGIWFLVLSVVGITLILRSKRIESIAADATPSPFEGLSGLGVDTSETIPSRRIRWPTFAFGLFLIFGPIVRLLLLNYGYLPTYSPNDSSSETGRAYIVGSRSGATIGTWTSIVVGIATIIRSFLPKNFRSLQIPNGKTIAFAIAALAFLTIAALMLSALFGPVTHAR